MTTSTNYVARPLHNYAQIDRDQLAVLRLVNHHFNRTASPIFFRRIDASEHTSNLPYGNSEEFTDICKFSQTENARYVRELVIGVRGWTIDNVTPRLNSYYESVTEVLPDLLQELSKLEVLTIIGPEVSYSIRLSSPVSEKSAEFHSYVVEKVFSEYLPFTMEHHPFSTVPSCKLAINQAPAMLESLTMDWQTCFLDETDATHRTDSQRYFRDSLYEMFLFSFLAETTNLKHLRIRFGRLRKLDLDLLDSSRLVNLQILELGGFHVSLGNLKTLLSNNVGTLRAVDLQLIQLRTSDWEVIYKHLESFPHLEFLEVDRCAYV